MTYRHDIKSPFFGVTLVHIGICHDGVELKIYVIRYVIVCTVMGNCHRIRHYHMSLRVIVCKICHDDMSLSTQKKVVVMTYPNSYFMKEYMS